MAADDNKLTVAYVPFRTFLNALDSLSHGLPHVIDRSIFPQMSGVTQSQLISSLKFLRLVTAEGKPTPLFHDLAVHKDKRAENLKRVLDDAYPELIQSDLSKATPSSLNTAFDKYGLTGETNVKAKSFFLQAAKAAGVVLSPYLLKVTRTVSKKKRVAVNGAKDSGPARSPLPNNDEALDDSLNMTSPGLKKVLYLDNSSLLTLTVDRNFGELPSKQRRFVNELIDRIEEFADEAIKADEAEHEARKSKVS